MTDGRETTGPGGVVREVFGGAARVVARARLSGGASRETWSVDVADAAGRRHALVLRLASGPGPEAGLGGELEGGLRGEAELMRQAGRAGVPVPGGEAADPLRRWRDLLDLTGQPHPVFELTPWRTWAGCASGRGGSGLKWGVICVMQAMRHLRGGERSVELAAIGRRVCENEWDLLRMLD
ncbi:hypothetical protein [Nonomuraea sp. NPDC003214]